MADGGYPNSTRANTALLIYRDAMREYIAQILKREHGPNWIHSQVLNDDARDRDKSSYDKRRQSLRDGAEPRDLIDPAEFPFLIRDNARAFPDLDQSDIRRMHDIRNSRNNFQHASTSGDCSPEDADRISHLCIRTLKRCGLSSAVASIHALSSDAPLGAPTVSGVELRKQRAQREWYKDRLAGKSPEELTPWEQERLAEIEWEEEWERSELVREEHEQQKRERRERERQTQEREREAELKAEKRQSEAARRAREQQQEAARRAREQQQAEARRAQEQQRETAKRAQEQQEQRERERQLEREREQQEQSEREQAAVDAFAAKCRLIARFLAVGGMAASFVGDFAGIHAPGGLFGSSIFPGVAMLATILLVATLPKDRLVPAVVVGMFGYLVAGAILPEPYEAALFALDRGDAGIRGVLLTPALVAVAQLDALLHEHGTVTACCGGLIVGGLWSKAVFWQEQDEGFSSLTRATGASIGSFTSSALAGVGGYGVGHTIYVILFLIVVGIPFAIVDIFADISLDEDVTTGDLFSLSILLVTGGVMVLSGGFVKLPPIARAVAQWRTQGLLTRSRLPAAVVVLVLPIVPAIVMFSLVAFPQLYFEHLMLPLIDWVYS